MIRIWPVCIRCATRLLPEIPTSVSGPPAAAERPSSDRFACPVNNHPGRYGNGFRRIGERPYRVYRRCHEPLPARPRPAPRAPRYAGTPVRRYREIAGGTVRPWFYRDLFSAQPGWWRAHRPRRRVGGVHRAATLMGRLTAGPPLAHRWPGPSATERSPSHRMADRPPAHTNAASGDIRIPAVAAMSTKKKSGVTW